jgi:hypothetical protein
MEPLHNLSFLIMEFRLSRSLSLTFLSHAVSDGET